MSEIRKIRDEDLVQVQEMAKKVIRNNYTKFLSEESINWFINSGESDNEFVKHFEYCNLITENQAIKGFSIFFENFIHLMMVDTSVQRKGYGTQLLDFAEGTMRNNGFKMGKLETFKENEQSVKFYKKNGWVFKSKKKDKRLGISRVFFEKQL